MKAIEPVTFSARAIDEAKKMMAEQNVPLDYGLRVAMGGGGCSGGIEPILGFDKEQESDLVYKVLGLTILVSRKHVMHLIGKHVEFQEVEDVSGFHFVDVPVKKD